MFSIILALHSIFRWLVLISLLLAIYKGFSGWNGKKLFTKSDNFWRFFTVILIHFQFIIGLWLYAISPIIKYFFQNIQTAMHVNEARFFGMEHSFAMLIAVVLITIGSSKAKRQGSDKDKFRTMAIWFSIALLIIFFSIPWPFLSFTAHRPLI
jgi:hypothetical protein